MLQSARFPSFISGHFHYGENFHVSRNCFALQRNLIYDVRPAFFGAGLSCIVSYYHLSNPDVERFFYK